MGASKAKKLDIICPNCENQGFESPVFEISWTDNHNVIEILETHCNQCGWAIGGEGKLRSPGKIFNSKEG